MTIFFIADDEFQSLCFEFGLELDEVVSYCRTALYEFDFLLINLIFRQQKSK